MCMYRRCHFKRSREEDTPLAGAAELKIES